MSHPSRRTFRIAAVGAGVLALVWQHVQATRLGYEVERSRLQTQALRGRISALSTELETDLSPAQLVAKARRRGMFAAGPDSLRILGDTPAACARETLLGRLLPKSWLSRT